LSPLTNVAFIKKKAAGGTSLVLHDGMKELTAFMNGESITQQAARPTSTTTDGEV